MPTLKKKIRSQIDNLNSHVEKPEEEQTKLHTGRKKDIMKIRAEIMQ